MFNKILTLERRNEENQLNGENLNIFYLILIYINNIQKILN